MTTKENKLLNFSEVFTLLNQNGRSHTKDQILKEMRKGSLKFEIGNDKSIDDFYGWCKNFVDEKERETHPLNWINIALYSSISQHLKDLSGIPAIIATIKKQLVKKEFEFVILPALILDSERIELLENKKNYYSMIGKLINDKKNNYFYLINSTGKISLKYCWIIKEIK